MMSTGPQLHPRRLVSKSTFAVFNAGTLLCCCYLNPRVYRKSSGYPATFVVRLHGQSLQTWSVGIMISDSASSCRTSSYIAPPERPKEGVTKKRAPKACQNCRARKVKCNIIDSGIPCAYCSRRNVPCAVAKSNRGRYDISKQFNVEEPLLIHARLQKEI